MAGLFGTDGVRGVANKDLTVETAFNLGRSAARILSQDDFTAPFIIGKDTRVSGDMLENALAAGICSSGGNVLKIGVMPTPGIAYITRFLQGTAGVVISASHNPVEDNGIKFFGGDGYKLSDTLEQKIEKLYYNNVEVSMPTGADVGMIDFFPNAPEKYVEYAVNSVNMNLKGVKVAVDCANGAAFQVSPQALEALNAEVIKINCSPNGVNINQKCGSTNPEELQKTVKETGADVGIAHDGDADRVIMVDEKGEIVDGDKIMTACALHMKESGLLKNNTLVVTIMSNMGLHIALKEKGINVIETKVGDRYVLEKMLQTGAVLGGEQSGHIIFLNHNTTGDGLITALKVLELMAKKEKTLSDIVACMEKMPQILKNVKVYDKASAVENPLFKDALEKAEKELGEKGRILVRPSGTESLVRIMMEGPDEEKLHSIAERLSEKLL